MVEPCEDKASYIYGYFEDDAAAARVQLGSDWTVPSR